MNHGEFACRIKGATAANGRIRAGQTRKLIRHEKNAG
jgi:hypothetical protein